MTRLSWVVLASLAGSIGCAGVGDGDDNDSGDIAPQAIPPIRCAAAEADAAAGKDATADLQACIGAAPSCSTLALAPATYVVSSTVHVKSAVTITTLGIESADCAAATPGTCAVLQASTTMEADASAGIIALSGASAALKFVIVDGNRSARLGSPAAIACETDTSSAYGFNMSVTGAGAQVTSVVSENALCGTGMLVSGAPVQIVDNTLVGNGQHGDHLWADGMTVTDTHDSLFVGNRFIDNTDVDMIFGGCQRCTIQGNTVAHTGAFAGSSYAAMMFQAWPKRTSGNYAASDISANQIDCGPGARCGVGLYLGSESWYAAPFSGGTFHDNAIANARIGFLLEKASGPVTIQDNIVTASGGQTWTSRGQLVATYAYDIPDRTHVTIADTRIPRDAYARVSFAGAVPNFWDKDVAQNLPAPAPPSAIAQMRAALMASADSTRDGE